MAMLRAESLVVRQGEFLLGGVSLACPAGDCLALIGPSGSGKTTCLEILAGLRAADAGRVWIDGRDVTDVPPERRSVSYLPQDVALFPHLSVRDNILFPARMRRIAPDTERLHRLCDTLGILPLAERTDVRSLSGGETQRVAIARALLVPPRVLFLDECFGSLDGPLRRRLARQFRDLREATRTTTVMVTHDIDEACLMADRLAVLDRGTLQQIGTAEDLKARPATVQVAELMGMHNILPVQSCRRCGGYWHCDVGGFELSASCRPEETGSPQFLGFFAWDVHPQKTLAPGSGHVNSLIGRVLDCLRQGPVATLRFSTDGPPNVSLEACWYDGAHAQPARGESVELYICADRIHTWPSGGRPEG